jgi:hypothetical protein
MPEKGAAQTLLTKAIDGLLPDVLAIMRVRFEADLEPA